MTETTATTSTTYDTVKARALGFAQRLIDMGLITADSDWTKDLGDIANAATPETFPALLSVVLSNPGLQAVNDPSICNLMLLIDASIREQVKRDAHDFLTSYFRQNP